MRIADNQVVRLHYKLTNDKGELLDSSESGEPLEYVHNNGQFLPALEAQLQGHVAGDVFTVSLDAEDAYGPVYKDLIQEMPRHAFSGQEIVVGSRFKASGQDGQSQMITVKEVHQNHVVVDANHPLAGMNLVFDIAVVSVQDPDDA